MITFLLGREETIVQIFILKSFVLVFLSIFDVRSLKGNIHDKSHRMIKESAKIKVFVLFFDL